MITKFIQNKIGSLILSYWSSMFLYLYQVKQVEAKQLEPEAAAPAPAATPEAAEPVESAVEEPPKRSTRTRQRGPETEKVS